MEASMTTQPLEYPVDNKGKRKHLAEQLRQQITGAACVSRMPSKQSVNTVAARVLQDHPCRKSFD
jgi:hypothetical protein